MKKEYTVPANFNALDYTSHLKKSDFREGVTEAMHYILDHIISYPIDSEKGKDILDERGGVPIYTVLFRDVVGKNRADTALKILLKHEVIARKVGASAFKKRAAIYELGSDFLMGQKK